MDTATCCPECTGTLARQGDETVCEDCGLVVAADRVDRGPEWRSFADDDENRERTGAPLTRSRSSSTNERHSGLIAWTSRKPTTVT